MRKVFFRNQFLSFSSPIRQIATWVIVVVGAPQIFVVGALRVFVIGDDGNIIFTGLHSVVSPESGHFEGAIFAEVGQRGSRCPLHFGREGDRSGGERLILKEYPPGNLNPRWQPVAAAA